jgi:hypothetical protein
LKALMHFAKAKAAHALIKELDGPNAAARVAAARTLLEENERSPAGNNMPQVPGFAILIADARASASGRAGAQSDRSPARSGKSRMKTVCVPF